MLWLCICLPRLPFDALSLDDASLAVITTITGCSRRIVMGSKAAEQQGFVVGMDYATASTLCARLQAVARNPRAELKALKRLAAWAYQWSSMVTLQLANPKSLTEHSAIWLEIAASFQLFGGRSALLKRIEDELATLNYHYQLGIAYSIEGAALLARAQRRIVADTEPTLRRQIDTLPLALLSLPETIIVELHRTGIRTIGAVIDLPRDAMVRRFGPKVNDYLDKLLGLAPDLRPAFQLPKKYRARCELGTEVFTTEALLFPLRRMLGELQGYLRAIDGGVQRFVLHLKHRQDITRVVVGLSTPERNAERFFALTRERLERVALTAPVLSIGLQADQFTPPVVKQSELFATAKHSTEQFKEVLDTVIARLGNQAVQGYQLVADHRPEHAWTIAEPALPSATPAADAPRPLWLLAEPRLIAEPIIRSNAERIEGGWWDNGDTQRDYYFVRAANGAGYWIYRDLSSNQWFLHGLCG